MSDLPLNSADLLIGADQIAQYLYGSADKRRRVYYLLEKTDIPAFKVNGTIWVRKEALTQWILGQENGGACNV